MIRGFRIEKWKPTKSGESVVYVGDLNPTKQKPWVLFADHHEGIDIFATKPEAIRTAEMIAAGKYDIKV